MDNRTIEEVRKNETNLINEIKVLEQQCKKQKEVIDKAVEYVEEHRIKNPYHYEFNCFMGNARASDLLEILEDKEVSE